MPQTPLVSVCIPTYNDGEYFSKMLRSILCQTYQNLDIVISDNASADDTEKIVHSFKDSRIRYYRNATNLGGIRNTNQVIQLAKSDFVAVFHSDDVYDPVIIEKEVNFFSKYPDAAAVFALDVLINEKDEFICQGIKLPSELNNREVYDFKDIFSAVLKKTGSFLVCPTFMGRKSVLLDVDLLDKDLEGVGSVADLDLWLKIAENHKIGVIKERLIKRRISSGQDTSTYEASRTTRANHLILMDTYLYKKGKLEGVIKRVLDEFEFNKFFDDLMITKNLLKIKKIDEANSVLLRSFNQKIFFCGFRSVRNFSILVIFFVVYFLMKLRQFGLCLKFFRFVNKRKPSFLF